MSDANPLDFNHLMQEAQKMQQRMQEVQTKLTQRTVVGKTGAPGAQVVLEMTCQPRARSLKVSPNLFEDETPEIICELLLSAINNALDQVNKESQHQMQELTKDLNIPKGLSGQDDGSNRS